MSFISGVLASAKGTTTELHKLRIWLGECGKIILLHVRHAIMNKSVAFSAEQQHEITTFTVLRTTWAHNRKSLILYNNRAQSNPVVGLFAKIVKCEQNGIIAR